MSKLSNFEVEKVRDQIPLFLLLLIFKVKKKNFPQKNCSQLLILYKINSVRNNYGKLEEIA